MLLALLLAAGAADAGPADASTDTGSELDLFALSDELTSVASGRAQTKEETPGVVTVITREQIVHSGARDLLDVLQLVPGFSAIGVDVEGVTDFGFRGIWGHEGKILFMIDGEPMTELLYDNNALGHHYSVDQIERIEINRGAGSVIYGGYAELAVINVITRGPKDLQGVEATVGYGQMTHTFGQADLTVSAGHTDVGLQGLDLSASLYWGRGERSDQVYTDAYGNTWPMANNSALDPFNINVSASYKDLHLRFIYDHYRIDEADSLVAIDGCSPANTTALATGATLPCPFTVPMFFITTIGDAYYDLKIGDRLTITPKITYKRQQPWYETNSDVQEFTQVTLQRLDARLTADWEAVRDAGSWAKSVKLLVGVEGYFDHASLDFLPPTGSTGFTNLFGAPSDSTNTSCVLPNGTTTDCTSLDDTNIAVFGEVQWSSLLGTLNAGARFEDNSLFGPSFVPRAALTKTLGRWHFKLLYSQSFRTPGIEDLNISVPGNAVRPERTQDAEGEAGWQINDHFYAGANVFYTVIRDPIIYAATASGQSYANFPQTGTEGIEAELRVKYGWGFVNANYSYYNSRELFTPYSLNQVPLYAVPGNPEMLAGFPSHKVSLNGHVVLWRGLSVNPSGSFLSDRYGQWSGDGMGNGVGSMGGPLFLLNLFVQYEDLGVKGLNLGAGCYDLLNERYTYLQPYQSNHLPLPGPSREFVAKLSYALPF